MDASTPDNGKLTRFAIDCLQYYIQRLDEEERENRRLEEERKRPGSNPEFERFGHYLLDETPKRGISFDHAPKEYLEVIRDAALQHMDGRKFDVRINSDQTRDLHDGYMHIDVSGFKL